MKTVITARDIEELLAKGGDVRALPADALLTPSARDILRDLETRSAMRPAAAAPAPADASPADGAAAPGASLSSKSSRAELEAFFASPYCTGLKEQICELGRRLWKRGYVDGNGGNIAIRVGLDMIVCTPTLVSKGFMKHSDVCLVDFDGRQILGDKKRTSEILMHLQMMQRQPRAVATVHCHPPHATAFAVAGIEPPTCMIPEFEVFCAVAVAPYRTPGTPEMGKLVADLVEKYNTILMANHGVVSWSHNSAEEAYWRMEIIEAYCRTVLVASQLGKPLKGFGPSELKDLLNIKKSLGFVDHRFGLKECELCDNSEWRPATVGAAQAEAAASAQADPQAESIVQAITEQVMARLSKS